MPSGAPTLFLAFRFHANFYHSYRGDRPDELGFGMDIRIIRRILRVLERWNARGVPVRAAWDVDNFFSLQRIIPAFCPDILDAWRDRVARGLDEIEVMSFNNGLVSASTAAEFDASIARALTNAAGSGVADLFDRVAPIVRPQEMMFTPLHLELYRRHGIEAISLFYSAVPFNAFSHFVAPLPLAQRFNPLTLGHPDTEATLTLLPAHNHGDVVDQLSLRGWLRRLRRAQLALPEPVDFLVLLDADADDPFWYGYRVPGLSRWLPLVRGLDGLLASVCDLEGLAFTTPGEYLADHPALARIEIHPDTADGSFDGFASWAEKWSNHQLWTGIERARLLEMLTRRLLEDVPDGRPRGEALAALEASFESRLLALSTTHFGLTSPVVNRTRLRTATGLVERAVAEARRALDAAILADPAAAPAGDPLRADGTLRFELVDFARGVSTQAVQHRARPSRVLLRVPLVPGAVSGPGDAAVLDDRGGVHAGALRGPHGSGSEAGLELVTRLDVAAGERRRLAIAPGRAAPLPASARPVHASAAELANGRIAVRLSADGVAVGLAAGGTELADGPWLAGAVRYGGREARESGARVVASGVVAGGAAGFVRLASAFELPHGAGRVEVEREMLLGADLPWLHLETRVRYPQTRSRRYDRARARALEETYDGHWREVMPAELRPALHGRPGRPLRVWRRNALGHVGCYALDAWRLSRRGRVDATNNHLTCGWMAVSDGERGLLVAWTAERLAGMAFCPLRTRRTPAGARIRLNPFGSYHGRQLPYPTRHSGLGRLAAVLGAPTLDPQAPSYNGRVQHFRLLVAPYAGDAPPEDVQDDALAFAYPPAVVPGGDGVGESEAWRWSYPGVAGTPGLVGAPGDPGPAAT